MCVLCNKASSLLSSDTYTDITHTHTHTHTHTAHWVVSQLAYPCKYIFTSPVICSQQLPLLLFKMSFLFAKNSLVKVIYLVIRFYMTSFVLWNTNNTNRNGVNKQNTHAHTHTHTHTHTKPLQKNKPCLNRVKPIFCNF